MRVLIVGGGKIGTFLARELGEAGHKITVIEADSHQARRLADEGEALVLEGDGTDVKILEEAGARRADYLMALTGQDEDNLVACQLGRVAFGCTRVLARLNDPRNRATFDALGVPVVAVTDLLVQIIAAELDVEERVRVALVNRGEISLLESVVPPSAGVRMVPELRLPPSTILVTVERDGKVEVAGARTELHPGDRVLAVTAIENEDEVRAALAGE